MSTTTVMYRRIEAFATASKLGSKRREQPPSTSVVLLGKKLMHMSTTTGHVLQENWVHNHLYHITKGYWLHHNEEDLIALQQHSGRCWSSTAAPRKEMHPTRAVLESQSSCFLHSSTWNLHTPKEKFSLPSHSSNTNFSNIGEGSQDFMHCIVPSPANILQILHQLSCSCCQAKVYLTLSCICLFHNCAQPFVFVPFFSPHYTFKTSLHIKQHNRSATKLLLYIGHRRPVWMIQTYQSLGKNQISAINYLYKTSSISLLPLQ